MGKRGLFIGMIGLAAAFIAGIYTPALAQGNGAADCPTPLALATGVDVFLRAGVTIRNLPSAAGGQVNYTGETLRFTITDGPVCADGFNWWGVRGPGLPGWVAEGFWITLADPPECSPPANLTLGDGADVFVNLRLRGEAGLGARVLTVVPTGSVVEVLEGPRCVSDINWWRVRAVVSGIEQVGWLGDGRFGEVWLQPEGFVPAAVCRPPLPFAAGTRAFVSYRDEAPKNLRAAAGSDEPLVARLLRGIGVEIIGGPRCVAGLNWWQIRVLGRPDVSGWMAEGGGGNFWLSEIRVDDPLQ